MIEDAEKWLKNAKSKLDLFTNNSADTNYIAYDMLENKNAPSVSGEYTSNQDIIGSGEKILLQLDG